MCRCAQHIVNRIDSTLLQAEAILDAKKSHVHIDDIRKCDAEVKRKCYLYHYSEEPVVDPDEFRGILRIGDVHLY